MIETIRLSERVKTQLTTLKRRTGVTHWNVLCRWAFCLSIADERDPPRESVGKFSNVEMTWRTFGGAQADLYAALLAVRRSRASGRYTSLSDHEYFSLHLNRGVARLLNDVSSVRDLVALAMSHEGAADSNRQCA
jgi:DNA sulfur modification protein DndE